MRTFLRVKIGCILLFVVLFVLFQFKITFAAPPISDAKLKEVVGDAINKGLQSAILPMGRIWIYVPALSNKFSNSAQRIYQNSMLKSMEGMQKLGLINFERGGEPGAMDPTYSCFVSITENGKKETVKKLDNGDYLLNSYGKVKVNKIVRNTEYKLKTDQSNEYRLILGVTDFYPSDFGRKSYLATYGRCDDQYKFKVLLKYDPFNNKYIFVARDWGYMDKEGWESNFIP